MNLFMETKEKFPLKKRERIYNISSNKQSIMNN